MGVLILLLLLSVGVTSMQINCGGFCFLYIFLEFFKVSEIFSATWFVIVKKSEIK